jgi:hypothetical protein
MVRLSCAKCGRAGQDRKQTSIERYGTDSRLPDLRKEIAQCAITGFALKTDQIVFAEILEQTLVF